MNLSSHSTTWILYLCLGCFSFSSLILPDEAFSVLPIFFTNAFYPSALQPIRMRTSNVDRFSNSCIRLNVSEEDNEETFTIKVTHQNKTMTIPISPNEPILQALEKQDLQDKLSLHSLPQDCRRGNCLTCSGRLLSGNRKDVQVNDDGLSPSMSDRISKKNLVLTCSSYVKNDGVHLELGVCDDAWREVWGGSQPWVDEEGEIIRNDAVARAIRMNDEKNLNKWIIKTEKILSKVDVAVDDDYDGKF